MLAFRVLALVAVAAVARAALVTDPNDARNWQGATVGTFAQLIYGADTPANRQLIIDNQLLDDGVFAVDDSTIPGQLTTAGATSCGYSLNDGTGDGYAYIQSSCTVTGSANAIDNFWFQSSGAVGSDIFTLPIAVSKVAVFTVIDHGPMPGEALESTVYLSNDQTNWVQASVQRIWLQGYLADDVANHKNLYDGFTVAYGLPSTAQTFRYVSIIHGGPGAIVRDGDNELNGIVGLLDNFDAAIIPADCEVKTVGYTPLGTTSVTTTSNCVTMNQNCDAGICETDPNGMIDVYYTNYADNKVAKVPVTFGDTTFSLGTPSLVVSLAGQGADGVIGHPGQVGQLLVGAQGNSRIHRVTVASGVVNTYSVTGVAYHLTAVNANRVLYTDVNPSSIGVALLDASGAITSSSRIDRRSSSDSYVTTVIKTPYGFYFTSSGPGGGGNTFGRLTFWNGANADPTVSSPTSFSTETIGNFQAHSGQYDPFSDTIILFGSNSITQLNAQTGVQIAAITVSNPSGASIQIDQGAVDGKGHIFAADNNGSMVYVSYRQSADKRIDQGFNTAIFLENFLDDVAPLIGAGGTC